ncbi:MAG: hypothetical protein AB7U23_13225 [Dehalococcoidia bacterium]
MSSGATEDGKPLAPGAVWIDGEARRTTLGEHGRKTVIAPQPFAFVPRDLALMARVGREIESDVTLRARPGRKAIRVVGLSLSRLGEQRFADLDAAARGVEVAKLTMGDLKYFGFVRRSEEQAGIVDHAGGWDCPKCQAAIGATTLDLAKLGVTVYDKAPRATVALRHPWEFEGRPVATVTVTAAPLHAGYEGQDEAESNNRILDGMAMTAAAIVQVNDTALPAGSVSIADLSRVSAVSGSAMHRTDYDLIHEAALAIEGGPDRVIPWTHAGCGGEGMVPLRWHADFF